MQSHKIWKDNDLLQRNAPYGYENCLAQTVTAIPARAGDFAGKKSDVKLCFIANDGQIYVSPNQEITVYNPFATAVAAGVFVTCKYVNGIWIVDAEDCA